MSTLSQQTFQQYAKPLQISLTKNDIGAPFAYQDWYSVHQGIIPGQEYIQYNEYLVNWFKNKSLVNTDESIKVKLNYLLLLRQLQLFFTQEETENWYNKIDVNNEKELLLAIPYFAKKLKEVSLYYIQLRKNLKEARLRYNQVGSNLGVVEQLKKIIQTTYSQKFDNSTTIPYQIWKNVPALSSLNTNLNVVIEDLYDKQNYFDLSPTLPVSAYFDLIDPDLEQYFSSKGLALTSSNWIYKLGIFPLSGDDFFNFSKNISNKYLGQNKYTTQSAATTSIAQDLYTISIDTGNNYFLWPGTPFITKAESLPRYVPTLLNDLNELSTLGTGGSSIETSDTIFIKSEKGVEGAWLSQQLYNNTSTALTATIEPFTKTVFRYPFPGYGLSGDGTSWTGFDLKTTQQFFYLDFELKDSIAEKYWSTSINLTSTNDLKINNTTLVVNGAYSNSLYRLADKIKVARSVPYNSSNITNDLQEAWLYKFTETDISIGANQNNIILWPYKKLDPTQEYPSSLPDNLIEICTTLPVSSIDFSFATAASAISFADKIYKLTNYQDSLTEAVECCWLSGQTLNYSNSNNTSPAVKTVHQPSFQGDFSTGIFTPFIWTGPDNVDIETVFKTISHERDCKYLTTPNTSYTDYKLCTCKQVLFTPFGHPGSSFTNYSSFADYIYEVADKEPKPPNLETARTSKFAWYQTTAKIGWGYGRWISNDSSSNNRFYLRTGKMYYYYRAAVQTKSKTAVTLPSLIVRHNFNNYSSLYNNKHVWIRASKTSDDIWVSDNTQSEMTLAPGDILMYEKARTQSMYVTSTVPVTSWVLENQGSLWSNYDVVAIGTPPNGSEQSFTVSLPPIFYVYSGNNRPAQIPSYLNDIIDVVKWDITDPNNTTVTVLSQFAVTIIPTLLGEYTLSCQVRRLDSNGNIVLSTWTTIPKITAISPYTTEPSITGYNTLLPGHVLKTPLQGWDYNTNRYNPVPGRNRGAKPFWAKTNTEKTSGTDFKGVFSAGNIVQILDNHNIITQPEFSDIVLKTGQYVEYDRQFVSRFTWTQPINLNLYVNKKIWNTLLFETSAISNLNILGNKTIYDLVTTPTNSSSNIVLQNYINNKPVEVHYNAINPFTWTVTAIAEDSTVQYETLSVYEAFTAISPWTNFSNQHYPTVAMYPTVVNLFSERTTGTFFTPSYLGASVFVDNGYTATINSSSAALGTFFEDVSKTVRAVGLTQDDILTPYSVAYNSVWLKEPLFVGPIAGTINKNIFKKYQKLIPYQSTYETNKNTHLGIMLPNSRQSPWTGPEDQTWGDTTNNPVSPTGEYNIEQWKNTQVLKNQSDLQLDNWVTDIFGNQYGLYKNYKNAKPSERKNIPGTLWVRSNNQFVSPAATSLSGVLDTYVNTSLYSQLTGNGIYKIDIFYDTLLIETANVLIFEKLNYDFNTDTIFSLTDNARCIILGTPTTTDIGTIFNQNTYGSSTTKPGETWFFPNSKQVYISVGEVDYTVDDTVKSTFYWEFKNVTSNTVFLESEIALPAAADEYIVSVNGVLQPSTIYSINNIAKVLTFTTPLPLNADVFVILPYNPLYKEFYDGPPKQYITSSTTSQTIFLLPDLVNGTDNESQYVVCVGGVTQQPKGIPDNAYRIYTSGVPRIEFSEPIPPNKIITLTRLPKYLVCSNSEFYSWVSTSSAPQTNISIAFGPTDIPSTSESYLVNIGGVLQLPSSYTVDKQNRQIIFQEPVPANTYICITQLSVPQVSRVIPTLYELDLNTQNIKKVFPVLNEHRLSYNGLSSLNITTLDSPVLSYNEFTNRFTCSMLCETCNKEKVMVETTIKNLPVLDLENITVYTPFPKTLVLEPPLLPQNLSVTLTGQNINSLSNLQFTCPVQNGIAQFFSVNMPSWITLSQSGIFTGTPPKEKTTHYATFYAQNSYGKVYNSLTVNISTIS